jgi:glyoxylase-like metal-dependent hydrolase (beta-lactamase superfamily II)
VFQVGNYNVSVFVSDMFSLDGGTMFGGVPKPLWSKCVSSDQLNRMVLCCRLLVLQGEGRTVLVDGGCGCKWSEKEQEIYDFKRCHEGELHEQVHGVTDVILTHLHFDHMGGTSYENASGGVCLSFPEAVHYIQANNWERALNPGPREKASYLPANIEPLKQAKLKLVQGEEQILPGVRVFETKGHTAGHQWVLVGEGKGALAFPGDLLPMAHHMHLPYLTAFDMSVDDAIEEKRNFLERALAEDWTLVFCHDPKTPAAKAAKDKYGRYIVGQVVEVPAYAG